jgi:hypothetical protein
VLIGPGDRIGTGNDIQSVEVGINLARPGTGMSNSLIQRLGRLLRQPGAKDSVDFYHLLGLPPETSVAPMDGARFIRNSAEFFAQTQSDGGSGRMTKVPNVRVDGSVVPTVRRLERLGAEGLSGVETTLDAYEQAYVAAVENAAGDEVVIDTPWYAELFETDVARASPDSLARTRTGPEGTRLTSEEESEPTSDDEGPPVVLTIRSPDGEPREDTFVVLVGESARMHGRTNIVGKVGFEVDELGTYTVASYTESGVVLASSVTLEELPTELELSFEQRDD